MLYLWGEVICFCVFAEVLSLQITKKTESANPKSTKCHICGRSRKSTKFLSPQICGFATCGTYLRAAHLCFCGFFPCFLPVCRRAGFHWSRRRIVSWEWPQCRALHAQILPVWQLPPRLVFQTWLHTSLYHPARPSNTVLFCKFH